jgi:hypothetical protein
MVVIARRGGRPWAFASADYGKRKLFAALAKSQSLCGIRSLPRRKILGKGKSMDKLRMEVEELPELDTAVAISGSVKQQEVGGGLCLTIAAAIAVYAAW